MNEPDQIMTELQRMMQAVTTAGLVSEVMRSYDNFATAALSALLRRSDVDVYKKSEADLAEIAWALADAMMAERKKRGLGGAP